MRVAAKLSKVRSAVCAKPGCNAWRRLNRHHKKHQAMFLGVWRSVRKGERKYIAFIQRYYRYMEEDIVRICPNHHAEIHYIYDQIIEEDLKRTGLRLSEYSWVQAERLMSKLEEACHDWLRFQSKGMTPRKLDQTRAKRKRN